MYYIIHSIYSFAKPIAFRSSMSMVVDSELVKDHILVVDLWRIFPRDLMQKYR